MTNNALAGRFNSIFVTSQGDVFACGMNSKGQNGTPNLVGQPRHMLKQVSIPTPIVSVTSGIYFTLFLEDDGNVWVSGEGLLGICTKTPIKIENFSEVKGIYTGECHSLFLKEDGSVWVFGSNEYGQLGIEGISHKAVPIHATIFPNPIVDISCGKSFTILLDSEGIVWAGGQSEAWAGCRAMGPLDLPRGMPAVKSLASGSTFNFFLCEDLSVWGWGGNLYGEIGRLNCIRELKQVVFETEENVQIVSVCAGAHHSLFLDSAGCVWSCGHNSQGQLGLGDRVNRNSPTKINFDKKAILVACGENHSFIVDEQQRVWTFGSNEYGQLGSTYEDIEPFSVVPQLVTQIDSIRIGQQSVQVKSARK